MAVEISGRLTLPFDVTLTHMPSLAEVMTTPPKDNGGLGNKFSPTDLMAASLGTCAATVMALYAQRQKVPLQGIEFKVVKEMQAAPRRIAKLILDFRIQSDCDADQFQALVHAGKTCPVRLSLHPEIIVEERYTRA